MRPSGAACPTGRLGIRGDPAATRRCFSFPRRHNSRRGWPLCLSPGAAEPGSGARHLSHHLPSRSRMSDSLRRRGRRLRRKRPSPRHRTPLLGVCVNREAAASNVRQRSLDHCTSQGPLQRPNATRHRARIDSRAPPTPQWPTPAPRTQPKGVEISSVYKCQIPSFCRQYLARPNSTETIPER